MEKKLLALLPAALLAAGCATQNAREKSQDRVERVTAVVDAVEAATNARLADASLYKRVHELWISERTARRDAGDLLPAQFARPFVFRSMQPVHFGSFVGTLQQASKANVSVSGDSGVQPPAVAINYAGPLRGLLHTGAQRYGIGYGWSDGGLELTVTEARTFTVQRAAVDVRNAGAGPAGGRRDPYVELEAALRAISPSARTVVSRSTNSITVVDRPAAMREIERYMRFDAQQAQRAVMLRWQLVNFTSTEQGEAGLAINYLRALSGSQLAMAGGFTGSTAANTARFTLTNPASSATGSSAILTLLNHGGRATVVRDGLLPIQNNSTRRYEETLRDPYPSRTTLVALPTAAGSTQTQIVPVQEFTHEEVGLELEVSATVHPSEEVDLVMNYSLKQLTGMRDFSNQLMRQLAPITAKRATQGVFRVKHGDTQVLVLDNNDTNSYDLRTGFGAAAQGEAKKEQWLLLVTPVITRGSS